MNSDQISVALDAKDNEIIAAEERARILKSEKNNKRVEIINMAEAIEHADHLVSKLKIEQRIMDREKWRIIKRESGK